MVRWFTVGLAVVLVACTSGPAIDAAFLGEQAALSWDENRPGAVLVVVLDDDGDEASASLGTGPSGDAPGPSDVFRLGSITKMFTALTALTLIDEGRVGLDDPVMEHVSSVALDPRITVRHVLSHASGLPDYVSEGFLGGLLDDPSRRWQPAELLDEVGELAFDPGSRQSYSNTNGIILGVLIEEVTGVAYHEAVRARLLDPLGLADTYLAGFEEGAPPFGGYFTGFPDIEPVDYDFTSTATAAWASGAMVSSAADMHGLFTAVFAGDIIPEELVEVWISDLGLGIYVPGEFASVTPLYGHDGRIPGSGTWAVHAPETGRTVFTVANADYLRVTPATSGVAELLGDPEANVR